MTIRYVDAATGKVIKEEVVTGEKAATKGPDTKKAPAGGTPKMTPFPGTGAPKAAGDRIDRLEKQLDAIMKELSELRKQMGRPGQGGRGFGSGFGPAGGGGFGRGAQGGGRGPQDPLAPRGEGK